MEYNFLEIEKKWQKFWDKNQTYKVEIDKNKPKYYILDMFPYPSGAGLHIGHPEGYTASDILARYKKMLGFNVLHPMGWDSFGLPAENYAIKTGTHPNITTAKNITMFKQQLKALGFAFDWSREIATSDPKFYKWTQWIFTKIYAQGLAYEASTQVNWCPHLKTVLANEEIVDGKSEIGGHPIERRPMKQWMLKITEYAERLLQDLEGLDWPENIKEMQRNWIGKSVGAYIDFKIKGDAKNKIKVFTTRADTLFGATYMVLAPEHSLVLSLTTKEQKSEVENYIKQISGKSDLERTGLNKEKTGVFTGSFAINPVNNQTIPIWISDYVLASYGTGSIMAVPAHDQRDFEFAKKFKLNIIPVLKGADIEKEAFEGDGELINSQFLNGLDKNTAITKMTLWLEENGVGKKTVNYKLRDWLFSRQRYWGEPFPLLRYEDGSLRSLELDELPLTLPEVERYEPSGTGESPLANIHAWLNIKDLKTNKNAKRETNTMPQWAGSCWYYLRFTDPQNNSQAWSSEAEKYWMPVDFYIGGAEHAVLHLLYARFWHKILYDLKLVSTNEPFTTLRNQGMILGADGEKMSKSRGNIINPDDLINQYGADSVRLYLMFMGPLEKVKPWQSGGVKGVFQFLTKTFKYLSQKEKIDKNFIDDISLTKLLHQTIKKVTLDIDELRFNTAISQLMIFTNHMIKAPKVSFKLATDVVKLMAPFAPHFAEEIWEIMEMKNSITNYPWPTFEAELAKSETQKIAIQINGKTRGVIEFELGVSKDEIINTIKSDEKFSKYFIGNTIVKEIFVPEKIANFVLKPNS